MTILSYGAPTSTPSLQLGQLGQLEQLELATGRTGALRQATRTRLNGTNRSDIFYCITSHALTWPGSSSVFSYKAQRQVLTGALWHQPLSTRDEIEGGGIKAYNTTHRRSSTKQTISETKIIERVSARILAPSDSTPRVAATTILASDCSGQRL